MTRLVDQAWELALGWGLVWGFVWVWVVLYDGRVVQSLACSLYWLENHTPCGEGRPFE